MILKLLANIMCNSVVVRDDVEFGFGSFSGNFAVGKLWLGILVVNSIPNTFGMSCDGVDCSPPSQEVFLRRTGGDRCISLLVANFVYLNILRHSIICIP